MKKVYTLIILFAYFSFSTISAQVDYNKWSVGLNVGGHYGTNPIFLPGAVAAGINHYDVNGRYMLNNRVGIMVDAGVDLYDLKNNVISRKSNYFRTSFQLVGNLGDLLNFNSWTKHIGLLTHAGFGYSVLTNSKDTRSKYNIEKRQDYMMNAIIGVAPQVRLGNRVSINLDVSYITHVRQDWDFTMTKKVGGRAFNNYLVNWSLGATFYLGKNSVHADWKPTVYGTPETTLSEYEKRIQELEQKIQEDAQKEKSN